MTDLKRRRRCRKFRLPSAACGQRLGRLILNPDEPDGDCCSVVVSPRERADRLRRLPGLGAGLGRWRRELRKIPGAGCRTYVQDSGRFWGCQGGGVAHGCPVCGGGIVRIRIYGIMGFSGLGSLRRIGSITPEWTFRPVCVVAARAARAGMPVPPIGKWVRVRGRRRWVALRFGWFRSRDGGCVGKGKGRGNHQGCPYVSPPAQDRGNHKRCPYISPPKTELYPLGSRIRGNDGGEVRERRGGGFLKIERRWRRRRAY